jgi:hypothetical protein
MLTGRGQAEPNPPIVSAPKQGAAAGPDSASNNGPPHGAVAMPAIATATVNTAPARKVLKEAQPPLESAGAILEPQPVFPDRPVGQLTIAVVKIFSFLKQLSGQCAIGRLESSASQLMPIL